MYYNISNFPNGNINEVKIRGILKENLLNLWNSSWDILV
jgi:hypothetical protein